MIIVGQRKTQVINLQNTAEIFADDRNRIKANYVSGSGCMIAEYVTMEQAQEALRLLIEATERHAETFTFPTSREIAARMQQGETWHHVKGKKTKGHGGS